MPTKLVALCPGDVGDSVGECAAEVARRIEEKRGDEELECEDDAQDRHLLCARLLRARVRAKLELGEEDLCTPRGKV